MNQWAKRPVNSAMPQPAPIPTLRIGELSRLSGRSVHAIRWYEAQGLVPGVQRDGAGRRLYVERHVDWLALMDRLRRTGMSIAEMRRYTALVKQGRGSLAQRREMLAAHKAQVLQRIDEWQQALQLVDAKLDFYGEWIASGQRPGRRPAP